MKKHIDILMNRVKYFTVLDFTVLKFTLVFLGVILGVCLHYILLPYLWLVIGLTALGYIFMAKRTLFDYKKYDKQEY